MMTVNVVGSRGGLHRVGGAGAVELRAYGSYDGSITDLDFLRHFPNVRRFAVDAIYDSLTSLDGLRHLRSDLESLTIGQTKASLDLKGLGRFGELRDLRLEGQTKGIETLSQLVSSSTWSSGWSRG